MNTISICLYSYRNKNLYNIVENIVNSCSGNNKYIFKIIDQNNIVRHDINLLKNNKVNVIYEYILWDSIISPIIYKNTFIRKIISDYHLQISDRVTLPKNWDEMFIDICDNNIVSGYGSRSLESKNKFMLSKNIKFSDSITSSNVIDRDLIFTKTNILKDIGFPYNLKYYGEEEAMSFMAAIKSYKIVSLPTTLIEISGDEIDKKDYVPFSLYHNYNDILHLYKENESILQEFGLMSKLYPLPMITNDVNYDIRKSKIDMVRGERYLNKTMMVD